MGVVHEADGSAGEYWADLKPHRKRTFLTAATSPDSASFAFLSPEPASQKEQDDADERAHQRAMENLAGSWQERLQLISVITTFFASMEAAMLVVTDPGGADGDLSAVSGVLKAANAGLLGALIMHVYSAVLSFLAAFLLTRWKLKEASKVEEKVELVTHGGRFETHSPPGTWRSKGSAVTQELENAPTEKQNGHDATGQRPSPDPAPGHVSQSEPANAGARRGHMSHNVPPPQRARSGSEPMEPPIFSRNPHLEQVGPFWLGGRPSQHLLGRMHSLCVLLATLGFALAIMGILCYGWARQPREVSIFATTILAAGIIILLALLAPDVKIWKAEEGIENRIENRIEKNAAR
ncbi:hypothetical protein CONPUDRAFT_82632 [Coniophora puteana RWD-64-598 SS2]|uniref:Transmembrane protein n=1 Tax=Coniophora puteana (strain RWD-64-598) TaxID=741705 RepID=A0A5M3MMX2_CONPW|nr:uncharacterized protein CONPUDRAFT_82632 [Coniophora puteana RWD-64-598 SS2]EIW80370.1 hypothetical protein CONPUDRAFT_82632 [Coniophora puteana RWD-64-598 SS2]